MKLLTFLPLAFAGEPKGDFFEWMWGDNDVAPIDEYVALDDGYFSWSGGETPLKFDDSTIKMFDLVGVEDVDVYYLNMTSQKWLDESIVTRSIWYHEVYVTVPKSINPSFRNKGFIYIGGGGNQEDPNFVPTSSYYELSLAIKFSSDTNTIGVVVNQIPNEALRFEDDHYADWDREDDLSGPPPSRIRNEDGSYTPAKGKRRSEDGIIAYTWWKFEQLGYRDEDAHWLLRFPMVKAVTKAMTAAEEFVNQKLGDNVALDDWMVAGASKRGWTTWMVGAVDRRVRIICPLVMDLLRLNKQMHSHFSNLGGYTFAFEDYYWENLTHYVDTEYMGALSKHVDPWSYRERYRARDITVYITNTGGDEFFLIDDNHAYFQEFFMPKNRKYQRYLRNAEHSMAAHGLSNSNIIRSLEEVYLRRFGEHDLDNPDVEFNIEYEETETSYIAHINFTTSQQPESVNMYYARSQSKKRRDFRLVYIGCPDKDENGKRSTMENCDCPKIQAAAEAKGSEIKGICPQFLFWQRERFAKRDQLPDLVGASAEVHRIASDENSITYRGTLIVDKDADYYTAAFMDLKFPSVAEEGSGGWEPILPQIINPVDYDKRGDGLTVSSAMAILPNNRPNEECYKETCIGSLV